jgi:hypothetical protein
MKIEEFLNEVATRDQKSVLGHDYVFPQGDVGKRIMEEIAARAKCEAASLPVECSELWLAKNRFLSAKPEKFVEQTMQRISEVVSGLKHENAKTFDLIFKNPGEHLDPTFAHCWGDEVQIRVRFTL